MALGSLITPAAAWAGTAEPPKESPETQAYVDHLIDGGNLPPVAFQSEDLSINAKGNLRSLVVELSGSVVSPRSNSSGGDAASSNRQQNELGVTISGRYQTDNYGLLGIDAELRRGTKNSLLGNQTSNSINGSVTLTDRNFPLGGGWLADGSAGMVSAAIIPLVRQQARFYIPASPLLGGTVTLKCYSALAHLATSEDPKPRASLTLSAGEPGLLGGLRLADFSGLSGIAVAGGGQIELSPGFAAGFQAISVNNTRDPYSAILQSIPSTGGSIAKITGQAALGTASYSAGNLRVQANAIWSHLSGQSFNNAAAGGWLDASYRTGRSSHSGGIFYFGPDLTWGTSPIINNAYGAYYRFSSSSQRWRWTFSLDGVNSVNGNSASGVIANADIRRQLTFKTSVGVNTTVRIANGRTSSQLLGFVDFTNRLGSTRVEAGWSRDDASDLYHLGWNQTWTLPVWLPSGSRLSTQLAFDHRRQSEDPSNEVGQSVIGHTNGFGASVSLGATPFKDISLDATLAFNTNASTSSASVYGPVDATGGVLGSLSSQQGRAFSATVAATARLSSKWSLSASFTDTRSNLFSSYGLSGLVTSPLGYTPAQLAQVQRSSFHLVAGFLTLRHSISAGRANGGIGRREYPVGGTGVLAGHVYLDANADHLREPSESGVAGIVVILDGIFAIRTDQSGYYRFEGVADGRHRVTVNADALPLPWSIASDDNAAAQSDYATTIEIGVRATTTLDIAASR